ncbi:putative DNA helicase [Tothia fuscella]|uniref:ATP-dependent DNA helicase CHL1 n=1 Tax=Tothia fuscella TaxID=1048955 RepID=A0A9P4P3D9_9PEZI|nr:putative DNA helicase [Tothia fuscella]
MVEHARKEKRKTALQQRQDLEDRLAKVREKERKLKQRSGDSQPLFKKRKLAADTQLESKLGDDEFLLDDYESDEDASRNVKSFAGTDYGLSAESEAMMKKLGIPIGAPLPDADVEAVDELKIFYCSRTHSQLSQFSNELRRVKLPPVIEADGPDMPPGRRKAPDDLSEAIKHLTLGSRKNLCINTKVNKLGSAAAISESCLELQKPGTALDCKCPFMPTKETEALVNDFRDHALASIKDIEDLGAVGKELGICPYYASRPAVRPSEIVTLPYPLLLQKSAREALNLSLKDHVVIIDEAHNLMDAITGIYSIAVLMVQLQRGRGQLAKYLQKFRNRLKGKNRVYVTQIVRLLDSIIAFLQARSSDPRLTDGIVPLGDLMTGKGVDQINLYKLTCYLQESKLARKVDGYAVHLEGEAIATAGTTKSSQSRSALRPDVTVPVLTHIQSFLLALMNPSAEGRFFYSKGEDGSGLNLRYMLLDPTHHFKEIVDEARAVILAGGTMSPMEDYTNHLFSYIPPERILTLSCGHVIPPSNLLAWPVTIDKSGTEFDFTFGKRNIKTMINSTGHAILEFIRSIPDGVVVFFPSYAYLDTCVTAWKERIPNSSQKPIWDLLNSIKPIFLEPRSNATTNTSSLPNNPTKTGPAATEGLLTSYSAAITTSTSTRGALLLSVIGGSLSEGINFSDRLGRAVIVIGLPFPNAHTAEWKAKMEYISQKASSSSGENGKPRGEAAGREAAREFYENATMRAVNQAVGRAIRHKDDYAVILLVDRRYGGERIQKKLPGWIKGSLRKPDKVDGIARGLREFFATRGG